MQGGYSGFAELSPYSWVLGVGQVGCVLSVALVPLHQGQPAQVKAQLAALAAQRTMF